MPIVRPALHVKRADDLVAGELIRVALLGKTSLGLVLEQAATSGNPDRFLVLFRQFDARRPAPRYIVLAAEWEQVLSYGTDYEILVDQTEGSPDDQGRAFGTSGAIAATRMGTVMRVAPADLGRWGPIYYELSSGRIVDPGNPMMIFTRWSLRLRNPDDPAIPGQTLVTFDASASPSVTGQS